MVATNYNTATSVATIAATAADGSATVVYTCPNNHDVTVDLILLSNNNAAAKKITAQFYDSSASAYYFLAQDLSVAANGFVNIVDGNSISLNANDKIILTAETAGTISALISVEEYYDPNR